MLLDITLFNVVHSTDQFKLRVEGMTYLCQMWMPGWLQELRVLHRTQEDD
jgi:hypothetical protein